MKKLLATLPIICAAALPAAADIYEYEPGAFDKLTVRADVNVVYRNVPDSTGFIRYESDRDFSQKLDVSCSKGKLTVAERMTDEDYGPLPTLYMYSDYLVQVSYEGSKTLDIDMKSATPTFSTKLVGNGRIVCNGINSSEFSANIVTGNGTIVARGKCTKAKFTLTGTGIIQADQLSANNVVCTAFGTGSIGCRAIETLDVRGVGSTKIYYFGNPTIKKLGGAHLEHMDDAPDEPMSERTASPEGVVKLPVSREPADDVDYDD